MDNLQVAKEEQKIPGRKIPLVTQRQWDIGGLGNRHLPGALLFTTVNSNQAQAGSSDLPGAGFSV